MRYILSNCYISGFVFKRILKECFPPNFTIQLVPFSVVNNLKDFCYVTKNLFPTILQFSHPVHHSCENFLLK